MRLICLLGLMSLMACQPTAQRPLDFAECERIARETFAAGALRYDLCPGYMPDGQSVELY